MITTHKLINGEWIKIEKTLLGEVFTEVLDDTLDTGIVQYHSYSDELIPVFTPIKVEHSITPNKTANANTWIENIQFNLFRASTAWGWPLSLGSPSVGEIVSLPLQTKESERGYYKIVKVVSGIDVELRKINADDEFFLTAEERITMVNKVSPIVYLHQLILVEPTKYLEKILVNNLCLTNKSDTLKQQLEKSLINCMLLEVTEEPIFKLSSSLIAFLGNTPGEDFFFDKATLREILDQMLSVKNARVYIEKITDFDNIYISYVDMNAPGEVVEFNKTVNIERRNDGEMYHGTIDGHGTNSVIPQPVVQEWCTFKTAESTLTTDNAMIVTEFPIERILKFEVLCDVTIVCSQTSYRSNRVFPMDITDAVLDYELFQLKKDDDPTSYLEITRRNAIYFEQSSNKINAFITYKTFMGLVNKTTIKPAIEDAIARRASEGAFLPQYEESQHVMTVNLHTDPIFNISIRIEYIPYIDTYSKITKPGVYDNQITRLSMPDSQSEKIISSTRHGLNLLGKTSRLGNDEYYVDEIVSGVDELKSIGQKTLDNFVIFKREVSYFNDHAKVRYTLTKNYNNLNEKIGINREKRIYDIPLTSYVNELMIKQYILCSHLPGIVSTDSIKLSALRNFIGYKDTGAIPQMNVNRLILSTKSNNTTLGIWELSTAKYAMGSVMHFVGQCLDNFSVGYSLGGQIIGGRKVVYNPYVNHESGEFDKFKVFLAGGKNIDSDFVSQNRKVPETKLSYYNGVPDYTLTSETKEYFYHKDAFQHMRFNYAIEVLPAKASYGTIVIGAALISNNGLFKTGYEPFEDAKVYVSDDIYQPGEQFKAKGTLLTGATISIGVQSNTVYITVNTSLNPTKSAFAVVNKSGNLLLACNDISRLNQRIYFVASGTLR